MDDVVHVHVLEAHQDAADEELDDALGEGLVAADLVAEVPPRHEVHDQEQVVAVLKSVDHIDEEGMAELSQQLPLVLNRLNALFGNDP